MVMSNRKVHRRFDNKFSTVHTFYVQQMGREINQREKISQSVILFKRKRIPIRRRITFIMTKKGVKGVWILIKKSSHALNI